MGRPYHNELKELATTYEWALQHSAPDLVSAVRRSWGRALVAVGSGGSLTAASALVLLHRWLTGAMAHVSTPYELSDCIPASTESSVWLLSAGGKNLDIRRAFSIARAAEPATIAVLSGRTQSPLMTCAREASWIDAIGFDGPVARDGFLATNSLLAFCTLLSRTYTDVAGEPSLPPSLDALLANGLPGVDEQNLEELVPLLRRPNLVVLHGHSAMPAAVDLESKFVEAGLGAVQPADLRNFGHGRHHWLAKHPNDTAVLVIADAEERSLCESTLRYLPPTVPQRSLYLHGPRTHVALAGIVLAMRITGLAGKLRGIDPGRPGVPDFGRKLYSLRNKWPYARAEPSNTDVAIRRKARHSTRKLERLCELQIWTNHLREFSSNLGRADIRGILFDYDGTLVETSRRCSPPSEMIARSLMQLLERRVPVGIATGRGGSVREALQSILPPGLWSRMLVGYRNGSEIGPLDRDDCPSADTQSCEQLAALIPWLRDFVLATNPRFRLRVRRHQLSIRVAYPSQIGWLHAHVSDAVRDLCGTGARVVASGHSIDVLPAGIDKRRMVGAMEEWAGVPSDALLRIGDQGAAPGNDHAILDHGLGLSVHTTSAHPRHCWNLGPPGSRGPATTAEYLNSLTGDAAGLQFRLENGGPS